MNASNLARYHVRQPRYILQPQDDTLIRVAGPLQTPWEETTEIRNISLSGISFTADSELCPIVGEVIKIEFKVPGHRSGQDKMACHGLVTRLAGFGRTQMLVGIQFVKLDMNSRLFLLQGLAEKLKEQQARFEKQQKQQVEKDIMTLIVRNPIKTIATFLFFAAWFAFILYW